MDDNINEPSPSISQPRQMIEEPILAPTYIVSSFGSLSIPPTYATPPNLEELQRPEDPKEPAPGATSSS